MMGRSFSVWSLLLLLNLQACIKKGNHTNDEVEDFALGADPRGEAVPLKDMKALRDNRDTTTLPSSFPLKVRAGKGNDKFDTVPAKALVPKPVVQAKRLRGCVIGIKSDVFQLNRYLKVKDEWIKMDDGIAPGDIVKIDPGQGVFLSLNTRMQVYLAKTQYAGCAKVLREKKTLLGHLNMQGSTIALLPAPKSPAVATTVGFDAKEFPKVYVIWKTTNQFPEIVDENSIPIWVESPIYQMITAKDGFYYVAAYPQLNLLP